MRFSLSSFVSFSLPFIRRSLWMHLVLFDFEEFKTLSFGLALKVLNTYIIYIIHSNKQTEKYMDFGCVCLSVLYDFSV